MSDDTAEDPNYWCDKSPSRGKNKGRYCGGNLRHAGKCGPWYEDEDRERPAETDTTTGETKQGDDDDQGGQVLPFQQPGLVESEVLGEDQTEDFVQTITEPTFTQPATATEAVVESMVVEQPAFRQPAQPPVFEEPDLRGSDGYQHPVTGEKVPGVTTISGLIDKSSFLVPWGAKLAAQWAGANADLLAAIPDEASRVEAIKVHSERLRHEGRDVGSLAHNTIEAIIRGESVEVHPSVQPQVTGFLEWRDKFVQQIVLSEATVWSHQFKFAGTMDLAVVLKDGRLVCVDIKTGKDVHEDAALQLNALMHAESVISTNGEMPNLPFVGAGVLHLPQPIKTATGKDSIRGKWSYRPVDRNAEDWQTFLNLRQVYAWEKGRGKIAIGGKQTMLPGVAV